MAGIPVYPSKMHPSGLTGAKVGPPDSTEPSLATLAAEAPAGDNWLHEIKFDGYRILTRYSAGKVSLISRNGRDWTRRFSQIAIALQALSADAAVLDGEVVVLGLNGASSFSALQDAVAKGSSAGLVYQVFDIRYLDGYDLSGVRLDCRKEVLRALLKASGFAKAGQVRYTDYIRGHGPAFSENACSLGLEGIVSKRADSPYRCGRSPHWLKIKCLQTHNFIICGYTATKGRKGFSSLLLCAREDGQLSYVGRVGTGFSQRVMSSIFKALSAREIEKCPLPSMPMEKQNVRWVKPELTAKIQFMEWTRAGHLRHPTFKGLSEDAAAERQGSAGSFD